MDSTLLEILLRARGVVSQIRSALGQNFGIPIEVIRDVQPVILNALRVTLGREYPVTIEYSDVPVASLRGKLVRYEGLGVVLISPQQSYCWKRFVTCKELAHLIFDENSERRTTDIELHLQGLSSEAKGFVWNEALLSEEAAIILAVEILVPWVDRANFNRMLGLNATSRQIAKHYLIPERIVDWMKGDYLAMSAKYNSLLDGQNRFDSFN